MTLYYTYFTQKNPILDSKLIFQQYTLQKIGKKKIAIKWKQKSFLPRFSFFKLS